MFAANIRESTKLFIFMDVNKVIVELIVKLTIFYYSMFCSCSSSNHNARAATTISNISVYDRQKDLAEHVQLTSEC
jgi:hypothetical protein